MSRGKHKGGFPIRAGGRYAAAYRVTVATSVAVMREGGKVARTS